MKQSTFDVVVVGAGHAGADAAAASARMGAKTALVTLKKTDLGVMSCNPAIGGLGKGHLVREIDALDGVMGRVADYAGIQFRLLNRRKGPAVQGPRAQADRKRYAEKMRETLTSVENLEIVEAEVVDFSIEGGRICGVVLRDGQSISARSVVLTSGTFLRGIIHIGDRSYPGGRVGDDPAVRLAERIDEAAQPSDPSILSDVAVRTKRARVQIEAIEHQMGQAAWQRTMEKSGQLFNSFLRTFMDKLDSRAERELGSRLRQLLARLDFNGFYAGVARGT